jgi:hypothetical protein
MATAIQPVHSRSAGAPVWLKVTFGILGVVVLMGVLYLATLIFGSIGGEEFSPQTFQRRTFSFFQIPLVQLKISGIDRVTVTGAVENHLINNKLIPTTNDPEKWDLVRLTKATSIQAVEDPQVLVHYLTAEDGGGGLVWLKWSEAHPEGAQALWPVVAELARQGLYTNLPTFFELARRVEDPQELQRRIAAKRKSLYQELADRAESRGKAELAEKYRKLAAE